MFGGGETVFFGRAREDRPEDRVARVVGLALAEEKRVVSEVEVVGAPTEQAGVEGDDERGKAGGFRAADEAAGKVAVAAPVELKKTRGIAHRGGDVFDRARGLATEGERNFSGGGGAGGREFAFGVIELMEADGRDHDGGGGGLAVDRRGEGTRREIGEHPGHDAPCAEIGTVGGHRFFETGAADVGEGRRREGGAGEFAEFFDGDRQGGRTLVASVPIDFHLMADAKTADGGLAHGERRVKERVSEGAVASQAVAKGFRGNVCILPGFMRPRGSTACFKAWRASVPSGVVAVRW